MKYRFIAALSALITLTGCASDGKVNDKNYLRAAAVDGNRVTMSFFSDENVTVTAGSLSEAKTSAELRTGKEIFTGYTELIVIDSENCADVLTYILSEWKVSPECIVAESDISGEKLLNERTPEELEGAVRAAQKHSLTGKCDIVTVLGSLLKNGTAEVPEISGDGFSGKVTLKNN